MKCCNTCEDVKKAYFAKGWALRDFSGIAQCGKEQAEVIPEEGCRIEGTLKVSKISGSFHLVPGMWGSLSLILWKCLFIMKSIDWIIAVFRIEEYYLCTSECQKLKYETN